MFTSTAAINSKKNAEKNVSRNRPAEQKDAFSSIQSSSQGWQTFGKFDSNQLKKNKESDRKPLKAETRALAKSKAYDDGKEAVDDYQDEAKYANQPKTAIFKDESDDSSN